MIKIVDLRYDVAYTVEEITSKIADVVSGNNADQLHLIMVLSAIFIMGLSAAVLTQSLGIMFISFLFAIPVGLIAFEVDIEGDRFSIDSKKLDLLASEMNENNYSRVVFIDDKDGKSRKFIDSYLYTRPDKVENKNYNNLNPNFKDNETKNSHVEKEENVEKESLTNNSKKDNSKTESKIVVLEHSKDNYEADEVYKTALMGKDLDNRNFVLVETTGSSKVFIIGENKDLKESESYKVLDVKEKFIVLEMID